MKVGRLSLHLWLALAMVCPTNTAFSQAADATAKTQNPPDAQLKIDKDAASQILLDNGFYGFGKVTLDKNNNWNAVALQHGIVKKLSVDQDGNVAVR